MVSISAGAARVEQHCDHRQLAVRALVHQMSDHRVRLAVDLFFARLVEMKLDELVARTARRSNCPVRSSPDRVTVIDHLQGRRLVGELNRGQVGVLGAVDVDGRLGLAQLAGGKLGIERAPCGGPS
jgi:hypothetical protein